MQPRLDEPDCARPGRQGTMEAMDEERATSTDTAGDGVTFEDLGLRPELLGALTALGYEEPTPIQQEAIPPLLEGRDLLGQAATGTGKTAAFALPVLQRLTAHRRERAARRRWCSCPPASSPSRCPRRCTATARTSAPACCRSTAARRSSASCGRWSPASTSSSPRRGGRSTCSSAAACTWASVATVVLDEADEMLDMGFAEDLEAILGETPAERQTVLFSATMPRRLDSLARRHLRDPVRITLGRETQPRRARRRGSGRPPTSSPARPSRPRSAASSTSRRRPRRSSSAAPARRSTRSPRP